MMEQLPQLSSLLTNHSNVLAKKDSEMPSPPKLPNSPLENALLVELELKPVLTKKPKLALTPLNKSPE
jgi:hypothetical protein